MKNKLVSIIIPTYNRAHLIRATLDSIILQTYTNWECIVVDDGSTDGTDALLAEFCERDNRFQFHKRPKTKPKGANACRNYGFEISKGEYIQWFDSDDNMFPHKLKLQLNDMISGRFDFSITQTEVYDCINKESKGLRSKSLESNSIIDDYINFKVFWLLQSVLYSRLFLIKNKLKLNESLQQAQDYEFHLNVLKLNPVYIANNDVTTILNSHGENMSNSKYDSSEKIWSNAYVNYKILNEFTSEVSYVTLITIYERLLKFYKFSLRRKDIVLSFKIWFMFIKLCKKMNLSITDVLKLTSSLIYPFLKTGYFLTNLNGLKYKTNK